MATLSGAIMSSPFDPRARDIDGAWALATDRPRCLLCGLPLKESEREYHVECQGKIINTPSRGRWPCMFGSLDGDDGDPGMPRPVKPD